MNPEFRSTTQAYTPTSMPFGSQMHTVTYMAQHNGRKIAELSPWREEASRNQDFWLRIWTREEAVRCRRGQGKLADRQVWIEVATFGDPASTYLGIVATEVVDDVWIPMIPLVVLMLGVATPSVRSSLSSLVRAAAQADLITPLEAFNRFDVSADAARSGKSR